MGWEIERKFLIKEKPADLQKYPRKNIIQGYVVIGDDCEVRLRKKAEEFSQAVKIGSGLQREEVKIDLTPVQFNQLWPLTENRRIEKVRYEIHYKGALIELDVYEGALSKLVTAEVEFKTVAESTAFTPPDWFDEEITEDERFKNKNLAIHGLPD